MFAGLMSRWIRPARVRLRRALRRPAAAGARRARAQRAVEGHELLEVDSAQQLHRVVEDAVRRAAVVVDRDRARMREPRRQLDLALEAGERALAFGAGGQQLDGRRPSQQRMPRLPDDAHRPVAQAGHETVRPDLLPLPLQPHDQAQRIEERKPDDAGQQARDGDRDRNPPGRFVMAGHRNDLEHPGAISDRGFGLLLESGPPRKGRPAQRPLRQRRGARRPGIPQDVGQAAGVVLRRGRLHQGRHAEDRDRKPRQRRAALGHRGRVALGVYRRVEGHGRGGVRAACVLDEQEGR